MLHSLVISLAFPFLPRIACQITNLGSSSAPTELQILNSRLYSGRPILEYGKISRSVSLHRSDGPRCPSRLRLMRNILFFFTPRFCFVVAAGFISWLSVRNHGNDSCHVQRTHSKALFAPRGVTPDCGDEAQGRLPLSYLSCTPSEGQKFRSPQCIRTFYCGIIRYRFESAFVIWNYLRVSSHDFIEYVQRKLTLFYAIDTLFVAVFTVPDLFYLTWDSCHGHTEGWLQNRSFLRKVAHGNIGCYEFLTSLQFRPRLEKLLTFKAKLSTSASKRFFGDARENKLPTRRRGWRGEGTF